jgi:hypothetical protein
VKKKKSGASLAVMQHGDRLLASSVVARMVLQLVQFSQHAAVHSTVDGDDYRYCVRSVLRIRDVYPGSRIRFFSILDPGSRIRIKAFKYFNPKNCFLSSRKYNPCCSSRIRILIFYPSRIPDPTVKRHQIPDPQHRVRHPYQ